MGEINFNNVSFKPTVSNILSLQHVIEIKVITEIRYSSY